MKTFGSIARAVLTLALSTAVLAACDGNQDNGNNGNFGNGVGNLAFPNSNSCGQPVVANGYQPYGARPYVINNNGNDGFRGGVGNYSGHGDRDNGWDRDHGHDYEGDRDSRGNFPNRVLREEIKGTNFIGNGIGAYPGGYSNGFGGCEPGYFPACGNGYGQTYQAGLMCLPINNNFNMGNVVGYGYNNGSFSGGNVGGLQSCGYGGPCPQIAQTCVIGMPNACAYGVCLSVNGAVGVCARQ